jgi:hypothetical protein
MHRNLNRLPLAAALAACLAGLAACASIPAAQMALPAELDATAAVPVQGIGYGREGSFSVGGGQGTFRRGKDRLEIFELVAFDRASTRYSLRLADGRSVDAACRGRQTTASIGILVGQPKPFKLECEWRGAVSAHMEVAAPSWIPGTRAERSGRFHAGNVQLDVKSVHDVQGSPLPLEAPIGYTLLHEGRAVGAIELNGPVPRLWRPADARLAEPVTLAALALALLWDPAASGH